MYFGGCEGGASHSSVVITNKDGVILGEASGEGTNSCLIGVPECCKRIADLAQKAKVAAGLGPEVVLQSLGMSLSGADYQERMDEISKHMLENFPQVALHCHTCNDTLSPLVTATDGGGVVIIAGTGSNCLLVNPSGASKNCGGWGHFIGDEGSACWMVLQTIKTIYHDSDGFVLAPHSTEFLKKELFDYFGMTDLFGILTHLYPPSGKIDKAFIARFCVNGIVKGCRAGDALSLHVMRNTGIMLGRHVKALIPRMENALLQENQNTGLKIICVGSVWKSWEFLKDGFLEGITPVTDEEKTLKKFSLVNLKEGAKASVGAAAWASKKNGDDNILNLDYSKTSNIFYQHEF
ncbi:N-acetyl-D-glucosamine kinase-like [Clytia hemisphaerica]|uniref:N-acetyl-D-glucosamine kinase n=1 Tax=Clytia hemisphaerica TaxID=252671 RepID=A0A7M5XEY5_9CNID